MNIIAWGPQVMLMNIIAWGPQVMLMNIIAWGPQVMLMNIIAWGPQVSSASFNRFPRCSNLNTLVGLFLSWTGYRKRDQELVVHREPSEVLSFSRTQILPLN